MAHNFIEPKLLADEQRATRKFPTLGTQKKPRLDDSRSFLALYSFYFHRCCCRCCCSSLGSIVSHGCKDRTEEVESGAVLVWRVEDSAAADTTAASLGVAGGMRGVDKASRALSACTACFVAAVLAAAGVDGTAGRALELFSLSTVAEEAAISAMCAAIAWRRLLCCALLTA